MRARDILIDLRTKLSLSKIALKREAPSLTPSKSGEPGRLGTKDLGLSKSS